MDTQDKDKKEDGKDCCAKGKCCGKGLAAVALLAVGGLGGYFAGRHCAANESAAPAVSAPAQTK